MPQSRSPRATTKAAVQPSQTDAGTRRQLRPRPSAIAVADTTACQIVGAHLHAHAIAQQNADAELAHLAARIGQQLDRKSTRLNSSHVAISYAVFCLKKKKKKKT